MDQTDKSVQEIGNLSFDREFDVLALEMVGYDGSDTTRVALTTDGLLKVTV
jgi:hypothetical protein